MWSAGSEQGLDFRTIGTVGAPIGQLVWLVHHHGKCVCGGNFMHVVRRGFTIYQLWCSGFSCSRVEVAEWRAVRKKNSGQLVRWVPPDEALAF